MKEHPSNRVAIGAPKYQFSKELDTLPEETQSAQVIHQSQLIQPTQKSLQPSSTNNFSTNLIGWILQGGVISFVYTLGGAAYNIAGTSQVFFDQLFEVHSSPPVAGWVQVQPFRQ